MAFIPELIKQLRAATSKPGWGSDGDAPIAAEDWDWAEALEALVGIPGAEPFPASDGFVHVVWNGTDGRRFVVQHAGNETFGATRNPDGSFGYGQALRDMEHAAAEVKAFMQKPRAPNFAALAQVLTAAAIAGGATVDSFAPEELPDVRATLDDVERHRRRMQRPPDPSLESARDLVRKKIAKLEEQERRKAEEARLRAIEAEKERVEKMSAADAKRARKAARLEAAAAKGGIRKAGTGG